MSKRFLGPSLSCGERRFLPGNGAEEEFEVRRSFRHPRIRYGYQADPNGTYTRTRYPSRASSSWYSRRIP